jgi:uncharacterized protein (DUF1015 family)
MAIIKPFKGYSPRKDLASQIASPPYDVLNSEEAREMAKENAHSFLHVVKSEIDFPIDEKPSKEQIYKKGAENLEKLIASELLIQDSMECLYLYEQQMGNITQIGLVAGASVDEYDNNLIKKHEHTRPDKEDDRAKHVEVLNANTGPVFLTYRHSEAIDKLVSELTEEKSYINFTANDGIRHTLWKVDKADHIQQFITFFSQIPALYVADGHHRSAAASRVKKIKMSQNNKHTGEEAYNYFLTVIFPDNQLYIMDYNRCVKDLNGRSIDEILDIVSNDFTVKKLNVQNTEEAKPQARGQFAMFLDNSWYLLTANSSVIPENDPVNSLDVAVLQNQILNPIFGIDDPRTNTRIDFIGGIRGLKELERRCSLDCKVAFALFPTGIDQLMAIADANEVMPPKSTWFEPKLRSGMVVRKLG